MKNYETEVRERWGNTDVYREHEQKKELLKREVDRSKRRLDGDLGRVCHIQG